MILPNNKSHALLGKSVALAYFSFLPLAHAAQLSVSSINGWNASDMVENGRWTGQPSFSKPPKSNAYKDMLAVESQNRNATFTIIGKNFGSRPGSVQFLDSETNKIQGMNIRIISWSDTRIQISALCLYNFEFSKNAYIWVSRDVNPPQASSEKSAMFKVKGFVGVIKTRGYGQCTWYVALRRIDAGLSIPTTAYATTGSITSSYVPNQWDCLTYSGKHVAIISSKPKKSIQPNGTVVYSFKLSEMNVNRDEVVNDDRTIFTFEVKKGGRFVSIGSRAGSSYRADGYWR